MKRKQLIYILLSGILIIIAVLLLHYDRNQRQTYYAHSGIMNLDGWNQEKDKTVELKGEWLFYPNTLSEDLKHKVNFIPKVVPHWWEEDKQLHNSPYGYATYELEIQGLQPSQNYAIDVIDTVTAYALYINGRKVAFNGTVGNSKEISVPQWKQETGIFQSDNNGCARIVIEVSNFDYYRGGLWNTPEIGRVDAVLNHVQKEKVTEMLLFAVIMSCALLNLGLYLVYRKNKTTLYFAFACIATAMQTVLVGQRVVNYFLPFYNWNVMVRLEYLSGYLMLPFFVLFFINLILPESNMIWMKRIICAFVVCCFVVVLIPNHLYSSFLVYYKWLSFLMALCFMYLIYKAIRKRQGELELMLFAMAVMIVAIWKENTIGGTISWIPYASLVFVFCFSYITLKNFLKIVKKNEELEAKVIIDSLTGLYNINYLKNIELNRMPVNSKFIKYFLFLDLDDFKLINDTFGHKIGDFVLREVGERFRKVLGSRDIICRYGGDEFICIVMAENVEQIEKIAQKIITEIQHPFEKNCSSCQVGISIGICPVSDKLSSLDAYIKISDEAMYQAKKEGKNRYVIRDNVT